MHTLRAQRRLATWIAILAVLLAALMPTVSRAMGAPQGADWVEVCSAQGPKWVQADADGSQPAPQSAHTLEHCPFCSMHAPVLGMPPSPELLLHAPTLGTAVPTAFLAAPRTLHAWLAAQPRAPPLFS